MANTLTGDFDVVTEFSLPAVNRILAAMHQCERFLHSVSLVVNDNPPPGRHLPGPVITSIVDSQGDAVANQQQVAGSFLNPTPATGCNCSGGRIVNPIWGGGIGTITPSHIQGRAQLQLFPPTVDVPDASGRNLSVTMNLMSRYFPDPGTAPLAEFIRANLTVTAPVTQLTSEVGNIINFDFNADLAAVNFAPSYSSSTLSLQDIVGINLLVQNALRTSFLPSSATLPSNVSSIEFKSLLGSPKAIAVLLNLTSHASTWGSVTDVFLNAGDDFAFAAGRDFVLASLQPIANNLLSQPFPPITFKISLGFTTLHITYPIKLNSASFDLQTGKVVLTINGHASQSNHSWAGPFDFTVTMDFSLKADLETVNLVPGSVSLSTTSLLEELVSLFSDAAVQSIQNARDQALNSSGAYTTVNNMFDINASIGQFLNSLLKQQDANQPPPLQDILMTYSSVDIQPQGIVAHGATILLYEWPVPYVEFEKIPITTSGNNSNLGVTGVMGQGPDYSALKSWIPGGTIDQYEWSTKQDNQLYTFGVDPNKFVLLHSSELENAPQLAAGNRSDWLNPFSSLCLTVRGSRISLYGPEVLQPVSATVCGYTTVTVLPPGLLTQVNQYGAGAATVALAAPGPEGQLVVSGYASAPIAAPSAPAPNLIVHFAADKSAAELTVVARALQKVKQSRTATLAIAVLQPSQLSKASYTSSIIYADDRSGSWESLFAVQNSRRPCTLIVDPKGSIQWKHEGALTYETLVEALSKSLAPAQYVPVGVATLGVRNGHPAPNFQFEYASGRLLPLSKLIGRPVLLVFWRSTSEPSIQAVLNYQNAAGASKQTKTVVLAVNDGESCEQARAVAAESGFTATLVTDPERQISQAYGVTVWPTIVSLDAAGIVSGIRYGYLAGEHEQDLAQVNAAGS